MSEMISEEMRTTADKMKEYDAAFFEKMEDMGCHPTTVQVEKSLRELLSATLIAAMAAVDKDSETC